VAAAWRHQRWRRRIARETSAGGIIAAQWRGVATSLALNLHMAWRGSEISRRARHRINGAKQLAW